MRPLNRLSAVQNRALDTRRFEFVNTSSPFRRVVATSSALAVGLALAATVGAPSQAADADDGTYSVRPDDKFSPSARHDNLPNPLARKQGKLREEALEAVANGKADKQPQRGGGSVVELSSGESVELFDNNKQANVWTVLSEFGDEVTDAGGEAGPLHNEIAEPNRRRDNSTQWTEDFNVEHFDKMFNTGNEKGESFRDFYLDQSNGEYTANVTTEDWVEVPRNGYYYGDNDNEAQGYWDFVNDTVDAWYDAQRGQYKSDAEIRDYLAQFDKWDRYDFDGDGNFNEADGYIDHFQAIHAGAGEEAGGGVLGEYAIWSHRWFADYTTIGQVGPTVGDQQNLSGGQEIGDTGMFVGDYTVEPENGGLGVFAHEYAHDLGLPDYYDTAGGENSTAFWTLMSSGSWLGHGDKNSPDSFLYGIGGTPNNMGPEEKLYLGWLDTTVVKAGKKRNVQLAPTGNANTNQAIQVLLPDVEKTTNIGDPFAGDRAWYSDSGDDLNNTLTRDVPAGDEVTVDAQTWYQTEADYDYWYAQYSTDEGNSWQNLGTFDGDSGGWTPESFSYDAGGEASKVRFLYKTDGGVSELGVMLDEITTTVDGEELDTDGAESDSSAWTTGGWMRTTGKLVETFPRYYLMENRAYAGYDSVLETGPYNFHRAYTRPDKVEHFAYEEGMLVWYVNHSVANNNTSTHPGEAYAMPVDARPKPVRFSDGSMARNRIQAYDATFGWGKTNRLKLSRQVAAGEGWATVKLKEAPRKRVAKFTDANPNRYYNAANPTGSVKVAGVGVEAWVTKQKKGKIKVFVFNPKKPKN